MDSSRLAIRRLDLRLETEPGVAQSVARGAIRTIKSGLAEKLSGRLNQGDERDDPQILIIRRLMIDISYSVAMPLDDLVEKLADAALVGIAKVQGERKGGVFFASRSAYVAAFLKALMDGSAWNRWWFRGFEGVKVLPVSAAVCTVLSRDWDSALDVLVACPPSLRVRIWSALMPADAEIILNALAQGEPGVPNSRVWMPLAHAIRQCKDTENPVAALAMLCEVAAAADLRQSGWMVPLVRRAAELRPLLADPCCVEDALSEPDGVIRKQSFNYNRDRPLTRLPVPLLQAMRDALSEEAVGSAGPSGEHWRASPLLGYAILLNFLHDLPIGQAAKDWPAPRPPLRNDQLIRLLILSACAGPPAQLWSDRIWRDLHGVPGTMRDQDIAEWTRGIGPKEWRNFWSQVGTDPNPEPLRLPRALVPGRVAATVLGTLAADLMHELARTLPGFNSATPAFLRANILGAGGSILIEPRKFRVRLERPPLDVLLGLSGLADRNVTLADGALLTVERRS